ncbi:MAG: hypothetical protein ABL994_02080 [Verrucomicrobiales bacterium]
MEEKRPVISFSDLVAAEYFAAQRSAYATACDRLGKRDPLHYCLAGVHFTLHCAGSLSGKHWFRAIEHLRVESPGAESWNIYSWDDAEAGWLWQIPETDYTLGMQNLHLPKLSSRDIRVFHQEWLNIYSIVNRASREAYYVPANTGSMPTCERTAPLRTILNFLLNERGYQMVHAAAIADSEGRSLLLPGEGHSGKSTTAIRWLTEGNLFQSDDLCAIGGNEELKSLATYQSAKLRETAVPLFPCLHPHLEHIDELGEKRSLFNVDDLGGNRLVSSARLIGILLPKVGRQEKSILSPAKPMEVMRALIPHSTLQIPKSDNRGGQILLNAISRLPAQHLSLGSDAAHLLSTLEGVFREHG